MNKLIFYLIIPSIFLTGCEKYKPDYLVRFTENEIVLDGKKDNIWNQAKSAHLHYYYGEEPGDSLDFSSYFLSLYDKNNLYFCIVVKDQIKYTHPKPKNRIDNELWDLNHYDRINLSFDINNNKIIDGEDLILGINYSLDSVFTAHKKIEGIKAIQRDTPNGYVIEIKIPLGYINRKKLRFNIVATDNDKKFDEKGFDVYSRWETEMGWGINANKEDISKRYGFIHFGR